MTKHGKENLYTENTALLKNVMLTLDVPYNRHVARERCNDAGCAGGAGGAGEPGADGGSVGSFGDGGRRTVAGIVRGN